MNKTKLNKAVAGIIEQSNELDKEIVGNLKDVDLGKIYINLETMKKAVSKIEKSVAAEVKKRKEITIIEIEKKIILEDKEIKIKKMTKKELSALETKPVVKPVKKTPVIKEEAPVKKPAPKKKTVKKKAIKKS